MTHHIVGLSEVARLCGVSLSTVNRKVSKLRDYGAEKDTEGVWHVPVTALEAAGFKLLPQNADIPRHVTTDTSVTQGDMSKIVADMSEQIDSLSEQNRHLQENLRALEADRDLHRAISAERQLALDDLRRTLRLLEAPSRVQDQNLDEVSSAQPAEELLPRSVTGVEKMSRWMRRSRR